LHNQFDPLYFKASLDRIRMYLMISDAKLLDIPSSTKEIPPHVTLDHTTFKWKSTDPQNALTDVSFTIAKYAFITSVSTNKDS